MFNPLDYRRVFRLPRDIIPTRSGGEDELHSSISSCSSPLPASSWAIPSIRCCALAGEESRCIVSSIAAHSLCEIITTPSPRWRVTAIGDDAVHYGLQIGAGVSEAERFDVEIM